MPGWMESYWSFRAVMDDTTEDDLAACARALLNGNRDGWEWRRSDTWIFLTPVGVSMPAQGWKLHIAATSRSAGDVLAAVMPLLVEERVPFKFAATREHVAWLNTANTPREAAGKFVTIYPVDDVQAVRIAQACDRATGGLTGPAILSDRPVRPGGLVHYRYGVFRRASVFDNDGGLVSVLHDPDGNPVPDERRAWFTPPAWATDPFIAARSAHDGERSRPRQNAGTQVLLNERYVVGHALKHANKGGVYLAEDRITGDTVVIKEARAHVEARSLTGDVAGGLRHEARLLGLVAHLRRTPHVLEIFEQQGHLFLVLEYLVGSGLNAHVAERVAETGTGLDAEELRAMIRQLAEMMQALHGTGVVLHDFTPNNLMVLPGGELRLVDLELAYLLSEGPPPGLAAGTPGFGSSEQMAGQPSGLPDDYYGLGATIAYMATGIVPSRAPDLGQSKPRNERLREWITGAERDGIVCARVCDLVLGCMADDPADRWSPGQVLAALEQPGRSRCDHEPALVSTAALIRAVNDIGRWLVRTVDADGTYLWPTSCVGLTMDPCNVQTGASGVGLFLCQASRAGGNPALRDLVATAARWVSHAVVNEPQRPPGLYFGLSGAAWFLAEAAGYLEDPTLLDRASDLALAVPTSSFNPDLTHGTAGIGLGQLHQWRVTGDDRFLDRAGVAAQALMTEAQSGSHGVMWPVTKDVPSNFAGLTSYGFAHGIAGITYFLLCAAAALGEARYRDLALEGVETLMSVARLRDGTATWRAGQDESLSYEWAHWCNGSSGVGTTLIRAYAVTGDERYRRMAELAAGAVMKDKWRGTLVQCHGLAGNAEFLLDLHELTGKQQFRDLALELASMIYAQRVYHDDLVVFPDEGQMQIAASFNTGLTGIGSFLLRLVHGGPRPLMADELLLQSVPAAQS
jgi:Lanthionine synthetase C-like protein/Protein kinase domain